MRLIGMSSRTHEWPSRSPDLNLFDFYFWEHKTESLCEKAYNSRKHEKLYLRGMYKHKRRYPLKNEE